MLVGADHISLKPKWGFPYCRQAGSAKIGIRKSHCHMYAQRGECFYVALSSEDSEVDDSVVSLPAFSNDQRSYLEVHSFLAVEFASFGRGQVSSITKQNGSECLFC